MHIMQHYLLVLLTSKHVREGEIIRAYVGNSQDQSHIFIHLYTVSPRIVRGLRRTRTVGVGCLDCLDCSDCLVPDDNHKDRIYVYTMMTMMMIGALGRHNCNGYLPPICIYDLYVCISPDISKITLRSDM